MSPKTGNSALKMNLIGLPTLSTFLALIINWASDCQSPKLLENRNTKTKHIGLNFLINQILEEYHFKLLKEYNIHRNKNKIRKKSDKPRYAFRCSFFR